MTATRPEWSAGPPLTAISSAIGLATGSGWPTGFATAASWDPEVRLTAGHDSAPLWFMKITAIINLGSSIARIGIPVSLLYSSTKGIMTLTRAWQPNSAPQECASTPSHQE